MTENKIVEAFLKGFNKPLILCLKPTYGYNLIKEFKRITGRELKPQRVYPFLYFLEEKGYITST
jgi:DNA-binding PadR family transcriptional regulator